MSSIRAQTAQLLLDRISPDEQVRLVRDVAKSLGTTSRNSDLSFAATLLSLKPDVEASKSVSEHLQSLIDQGELDQVVSVCIEHVDVGHAVLERACSLVPKAAAELQSASKDYFTVPVLASEPGPAKQNTGEDEHFVDLVKRTTHSLRLVNRIGSQRGLREYHVPLFKASLVLLGATDHDLRAQAQEVLFFLLASRDGNVKADQQDVWSRVKDLIGSPDKFYKALGYSVWLRWISAAAEVDSQIVKSPDYWRSIINGLYDGDTERRKSCLQILRASVDVAMHSAEMLESIATPSAVQEFTPDSRHSEDGHPPAPATIQKHYARYCTVFETIVLGRYLNQVQECEADLDFLSSEKSVVKPIWVYTLLTCALDQKMQETNRKLIGSWVMHVNPRVDGKEEYIAFLRDAFLPWATLGYLFTGSLRRQDGNIQCEHGDRLSSFVAGLLQSHSELFDDAVETILASISGRYGNRFAQAKVYLIDGIAQAVKQDPTLTINATHLEKMYEIATWANLTEVARDYLFAQCWNLCSNHARKQDEAASTDFLTLSRSKWDALTDKAKQLGPNSTAEQTGSIGSMALPPSNREKNESKAQQRCRDFLQSIQTRDVASIDASALEEELNEIWNDLEYLEYPKGLLTTMASVFLDHNLMQLSITTKSDELAEIVATKTNRLLELAEPRSYMLASLLESIRDVVTRVPESAATLQLSALIVHVAKHPPSATIDVQLEEALVPLISGIGPSMSKFSYEFYFGRRESLGFAALLDLASRVGAIDPKLPRITFNTLFEPWLTQKIPPNVVSPWKTGLELQVMLLCAEQFVPNIDSNEARRLLTDVQFVLSVEPLPRYRYLLEWMVARIYIRHPELRHVIFAELRTKDHHANPKFLASLMKIGVRIAKAEGADEAFALQLATLFVPLAASSKVVIRHEAQWQVPILLDHVRHMQIEAITSNTAFEALDEFIRSLERFDDPPLERQIGLFDPVKDHNLTHLVEGAWHDLDDVEKRLCSRADLVTLYDNDKEASLPLPPSCIPLGDPITSRPTPPTTDQPTPIDHSRRLLQNIDNISRALGSGAVSTTALQTKGVAYLSSTRTRHSTLFVIASLVDNPYNLGGLSRVSEIFGAAGLYLEHPRVTSNKDFTSTAVSSHLHLDITALAPAEIPAFLARKKREEGFSVVGIEQTDRSVMLGEKECVLAEKCILVMGSEREGIPALVLSECDVLVEIPQVGITRSLNVQTAAGIVLCEYARQHNGKLK
ncbi:Putative tRNA/rRNA methyltransferase, SpoU type, tRNA (guanine-N1-)-methyltransferase [Septoria linicola]|uniref:tRNA/rRNA methyltransferase, SpoU type, tRNA (Guanine-N1-)-methyltransferase n=1 Tax=Septoria linicola TaxID=215465 RepID=A0A9Q9ANW5_9PEZI|nr:Putative tRNA/rRNA methyltransferase, SpoU type, tRNA (guanine-N1-)-methyltransferase [Septoria linicola]